jgi:hypothetical protein
MMMGNWCDCVALFCSLLVIECIALNKLFINYTHQTNTIGCYGIVLRLLCSNNHLASASSSCDL